MTTKVTFTLEEGKRIYVLRELDARRLTAREAAESWGVTLCHVRRLLQHYRLNGEASLVPGHRGRVSTQRLDEKTRATTVKFACTTCADYHDFHLTKKWNEAPYALGVSR